VTLPQPMKQRWQPLRAGLVDLFYYDVEEFHFHGGSLLLRGNNGTGKSKVLALTLPFLLDGELSPYRVEPDGDKNKRMEWNLLLGGKYPHPERLGYTWLEFGRRDSAGECHYATLGCGLKAVAGKGVAAHWFFVTDQRIGDELSLLTAAQTALTHDRLREAIGSRGMVYKKASDYRRRVDEVLFGLAGRYDALVSLLIQLRQPQLSKRPDEKLLSRALTEALAPLDDNLITQVADAFRSLDDERDTLRGLVEAKHAADNFLGTYRRYARIATKRHATSVRQQQSRYDQLGRDMADAQRAFDEAEATAEHWKGEAQRLTVAQQRLEAEERALRESPEARAADNLDNLNKTAIGYERIAKNRKEDVVRCESRLREAGIEAGKANDELHRHLDAKSEALGLARVSAAAARLADRHSECEALLGEGVPPFLAARAAAKQGAEWRTTSLSTLDNLMAQALGADQILVSARERLDQLDSEVADAEAAVLHAQQQATAQGAALIQACQDYFLGTQEIALEDLEDALSQLEAWVDTLAGDNPVTLAVAAAVTAAGTAIGRRQGQLDSDERDAKRHIDQIKAELRRLIEGAHEAPPLPHTRRAEVRQDKAGAPLWRVVDFAEEMTDADRAGLEAALEAAGILDAWIEPDGTLRSAADGDVIVVADKALPRNLGALLKPAIDNADPQAAALNEPLIRDVLQSIGVGPDSGASTWISTSGQYQIGPLHGRWSKATAAFIGEGAREQARRLRIAQLHEEVEQVHAALQAITDERSVLAMRRERLAEEQANCPADTALRDAFAQVRSAADARRRLIEGREGARAKVREADGAARRAHAAVADFAADVNLPIDLQHINAVKGAIVSYQVNLEKMWNAAANAFSAAKRLEETQSRLAQAEERLSGARDDYTEATQDAIEARDRYEALNNTVGATVAELQRRLGATDASLRLAKGELDAARTKEYQAREARGVAEGERRVLSGDLVNAGLERDKAVEQLRTFAKSGLLQMACPELETPNSQEPWAPTPAVLLARAVDRDLSNLDDGDASWQRSQESVANGFKTLDDSLGRQGHRASLTPRDGIILVDVAFLGRVQPIDELAKGLAEEIDERQRVLSAREREVLENHLVNEVAGTLQELITAAETQVARMNDELELRPTSTGMRLRLRWRTAKDAPDGLTELRGRQLRQSTDVWNDEDRRKVGVFLQEQINRERDRDEAATWHEQLTRALDYRAWHEFAIERYQDGVWRPATGPASGGERVLAATVPLFAAASSYYSSAGNPDAPRLIALDEAFAGVDDDARAKCLGLLATFDLDVVMTSEREWGCYPQVPGLAIAQLTRHDGIDAVLVTPWRWDGHERVRVPRPTSMEPVP
jgi:uncharacterized protein (TIGR02680 family)